MALYQKRVLSAEKRRNAETLSGDQRGRRQSETKCEENVIPPARVRFFVRKVRLVVGVSTVSGSDRIRRSRCLDSRVAFGHRWVHLIRALPLPVLTRLSVTAGLVPL